MNVYVPKRRSRGEWIARAFADGADIRTVRELLAFLACGALTVLLAWMVTHPQEFYLRVLRVVSSVVEALPWPL